jgi:hypothetical protein
VAGGEACGRVVVVDYGTVTEPERGSTSGRAT